MQKDFLSEVGENYEYVRTIVSNKIKLLKIETYETASNIVSYLLLGVLLLSVLVVFLGIVLTLIAVSIQFYTDSWLISLAITGLIPILLTVILIVFRKRLIINPVENAFFRMTEDKI